MPVTQGGVLRAGLFLVAGMLALVWGVPANAQDCSASNITSLDFGPIDVTANTAFLTSGT
jgi:hypothetical protein